MKYYAAAAVVAAFVIGLSGLRKDWRADRDSPQWRQPSGWPYTAEAWLGFRRLTLPAVLTTACLGVGVASRALLIPAGIAFLVLIVLGLLVFAVNWPKRLVPPARRADIGVLTAYLGRRRSQAT